MLRGNYPCVHCGRDTADCPSFVNGKALCHPNRFGFPRNNRWRRPDCWELVIRERHPLYGCLECLPSKAPKEPPNGSMFTDRYGRLWVRNDDVDIYDQGYRWIRAGVAGALRWRSIWEMRPLARVGEATPVHWLERVT